MIASNGVIASGRRFTPKRISGLVAWYELLAASDYTIATGISSWTDRAAVSGNATQGTAANQPAYTASVAGLNNTAAATHDNTDRLVAANTIDLSAAYTIVRVLRTATLASWHGLARVAAAEATGTDGICVYVNASGVITLAPADATAWYRETSAGALASNTSYVLSVRCSGTSASLSLRLNGSSIALGSLFGTFAMPAASSKIFLGCGWNNGRFVGNDGGTAVYNRSLSDAETLRVERYFGARRGIVF